MERIELVALNLFDNRLTNAAFTVNLFPPPFVKVVQFFVSIKQSSKKKKERFELNLHAQLFWPNKLYYGVHWVNLQNTVMCSEPVSGNQTIKEEYPCILKKTH